MRQWAKGGRRGVFFLVYRYPGQFGGVIGCDSKTDHGVDR